MDSLNDAQMPKIKFNNEPTKTISGAVCVGSPDQIRVAFLEEKLDSDEYGNVEMIQECVSQVVMTPQVARNIIQVLEDNLNSSNY
ncbi:MAG: hypothetical protein IJJ47_00240 [Methanosphaera sp.]|nr:hypothetical protein [Methanosphaera sp.]